MVAEPAHPEEIPPIVATWDAEQYILNGRCASVQNAPEARLATIYERVCALLDEHLVQDLAVEDLYFGANARSAFAVGVSPSGSGGG